MSLIKSISGIRGTIGGAPGDTLNPLDIVRFVSAYATFINGKKIVVGRDARISGDMVRQIVCGTLVGMGYEVVDIGLATTPTTELAVTMEGADGGIIITASHNPRHWNALKLLNSRGEFLSAEDGAQVLALAERDAFVYADVDTLGSYSTNDSYDAKHIQAVLDLELVDTQAIRAAKFRVAVDAINSVGGTILPKFLEALGVDYTILNGEPNGDFAHNPEPLAQNLTEIMSLVSKGGYDLGIVVDPDVDRLAFISEDGTMFGEEYTLVAVADYVLAHTPGNTVSNLSSTRALRDITLKHGGTYAAAAVGEVNVVTKMREVGAVIGGEGNGGVIYPACHSGRDALVGIALMLSHLANQPKTASLQPTTMSALRATLPNYFMAKNRIDLASGTDVDAILARIKEAYKHETINDIDGVKIDFADKWVHLRKSNTEPIIRVYSEAPTMAKADALAQEIAQLAVE